MSVPYQAYKSKRHSRSLPLQSSPPQSATLVPTVDQGPSSESLSVPVAGPSSLPHPAATSTESESRTHSKYRHVPFRPLPTVLPSNPKPESRVHSRSSSVQQLAPEPEPSNAFVQPSIRSSSLASSFVDPKLSKRINPPPEHNPIPALTITRPPPPTTTQSSVSHHAALYRPGFQPKGVYRHRTDDFLLARKGFLDHGKVELDRLTRRLDKIIELHFGDERPRLSTNRRQSSFFDMDFTGKSAGDLWREVVESRITQSSSDHIRIAEQSITPWQNDRDIKCCPICEVVFHPLSNRKHHCRICGRIVCALPEKPPTRIQRCSTLFVADLKASSIEEVDEAVDYGVRKRTLSTGANGVASDDKFVKGVRLCSDCRPVLLKKKFEMERRSLPTIAKLHHTLVDLEEDILNDLTIFQSLVDPHDATLSASPAETAIAKAKLMETFAEYETVARKIGSLPVQKRGGSLDRIQKSIATRASMFLQKNMLPLKAIPKHKKKNSTSTTKQPIHSEQLLKTDSASASKLQTLLEQEIIIETFMEEARSRRKFDDVKTLALNLNEIRQEIGKMESSLVS